MITDLPNELLSALSQGLSQFGINLPPMPTSLLTGSGPSTPATMTTPGLGMTPMTTPGLGVTPATTPGLGVTPATTPGLGIPSLPTTLPDAALNSAANTNPSLTSPVGLPPLDTVPAAPGGLTTPPTGLTTPPTIDPALATPISNAAGLPAPNEVPISAPIGLDPLAGSAPIGLDPLAGSYPIMGDPSLAAMPASGSGGLMGDLSSMANQLGAGQAIDLLKGMVMPAIMSAMKPGAVPGAPAPAAVPPAAAAAAAPVAQAATQAAESAANAASPVLP